MLVQVKEKGLMAFPKEFLNKAHVRIGDFFEVTVKDGEIVLHPVDVCDKGYVKKLEKQLAELQKAVEVKD